MRAQIKPSSCSSQSPWTLLGLTKEALNNEPEPENQAHFTLCLNDRGRPYVLHFALKSNRIARQFANAASLTQEVVRWGSPRQSCPAKQAEPSKKPFSEYSQQSGGRVSLDDDGEVVETCSREERGSEGRAKAGKILHFKRRCLLPDDQAK